MSFVLSQYRRTLAHRSVKTMMVKKPTLRVVYESWLVV